MSFRPKLIKHSEIISVTILSGDLSGVVSLAAGYAVVLANTVIKFLGYTANNFSAQTSVGLVRVDLTSTTQISAFIDADPTGGAAADQLTAVVQVTEYYSGIIRNLQRGTLNIAEASSGSSVTITRNTNFNYSLDSLGCEQMSTIGAVDGYLTGAFSLSGTTLSFSRASNPGSGTGVTAKAGYQYYEM